LQLAHSTCLDTVDTLTDIVHRIRGWCALGGYAVLSMFNDRSHSWEGHPEGFAPLLVSHSKILKLWLGWELLFASDTNLTDSHGGGEVHTHSISRLLLRKPRRGLA